MLAFARGRRALTVASLAMVLVAILHTVGNLAPPPIIDEQLVVLRRQMQSVHLPFGLRMAPSVWDIQRSLVFTMSVCLLAIGLVGLLVAADRDATPRLRSRVATIAAAASGMLTALYAVYRVPPPLLMLGTVTLLYAYSIRYDQRHE
jgi:hypothetical protein